MQKTLLIQGNQPFTLSWAIQMLCFYGPWMKHTSTFKLFPQGFDSQLGRPGLLRNDFPSHNPWCQLTHCYIREETDIYQDKRQSFLCGWGKRHLPPPLLFLTAPRLATIIGRWKNGIIIFTSTTLFWGQYDECNDWNNYIKYSWNSVKKSENLQ